MHLSYFPYFALKKNITKKKAIDQEIANQLKFEKRKQLEQEIDLIINSMVFAKKIIDNRLFEVYYLIY